MHVLFYVEDFALSFDAVSENKVLVISSKNFVVADVNLIFVWDWKFLLSKR